MFENTSFITYILKRKNKKVESITKSSNGVCKYCGKDTITFFFINQEGSILKLGCRCRNCANSYDLIKSAPFDFRLVVDGDKIGTYRDYDLNIIKQLDKLDALNAKENVPRETPIKVSLGSVVKEPITFNFDFKKDESFSTIDHFQKWLKVHKDIDKKEDNLDLSLVFGIQKQLDKKDNVFKKYIRTKKYMKFVKEKK